MYAKHELLSEVHQLEPAKRPLNLAQEQLLKDLDDLEAKELPYDE